MDRHNVNYKVFIAAFIICLVSLIRYLPYIYKGASPWLGYNNLILARNYAQTGKYSLEDNQGVVLTSSEVKEKGQIASLGNALTPLLYAQVFKTFGFNQELPVKVSVILFALSSALIFLLIYRLFGWLPAVIAAALDLFLPVTWLGSLVAGFYEWAVFFFAIACLIYFWQKKAGVANLLISGILLGLAFCSRNAFLLSVPAIFMYDFICHKKIQRLIIFGAPVLLIFLSFIIPGWLSPENQNPYLGDSDTSFARYDHVFNDPYTYYYDREDSLSQILISDDPNTTEFLIKYHFPISFKNIILMYVNSIKYYPVELLRLTNFGGPLIGFLMIIGLVFLWAKDRKFAYFVVIWLISWYLLLICLKTDNWDHFLEIRWLLLVLAALGVNSLFSLYQSSSKLLRKYLPILVLVILPLQMLFSAQWMFHEEYATSQLAEQRKIVELIQNNNLNKKEVVVLGNSSLVLAGVNYYTNQSLIYFHPETIIKLTNQKKLAEAFNKFDVKYAVGYSPELIAGIKNQTKVKILE